MFRKTARTNAISQFKKDSKPSQWSAIIAKLSVNKALAYFRQLLSFYNSAQNPALDRPFASAFSALLSTLLRYSAEERIRELPLTDYDLEKLTTLILNSHACQEPMPVKINTLLIIAGKTDRLDWAKYIYNEMNKNNLSNMSTHNIAIKIFDNARDMQRVESAFAAAQGLNLPLKQTRYLYKSMLEACYHNNALERAIEIYEKAAQGNLTSPTIWNTMIKIAGKLENQKMAQDMLTLIMNYPVFNKNLHAAALRHFAYYFPNQKPFRQAASARAPERVQSSAPPKLEGFSFFHFSSFRLKALSGSDLEEKEHSPETTKTREVWQQLMQQPAPIALPVSYKKISI